MTTVTRALIWRPAAWLARLDRVVLATAALLGALFLAAPPVAAASLAFTLDSLVAIAPFVLLSAVLGGYVKAAGIDRRAGRVFAGHAAAAILVAAAFGALSPFCSCGVIPLIAALLSAGVPLAPVMAFWLASPVMDPEMFVLTAQVLGVEFALAKTVAAVGLGVLGGFATLAVQRAGGFEAPLRRAVSSCAAAAITAPAEPLHWRVWDSAPRRAAFVDAASAMTLFLAKWLTLAFVLESLMLAYLPADAIAARLGGDSAWAIPLAVAVGVPAYLNGYAAIPTVAGLMAMGMAPGPALAFMVAGSVTSIPAALAVWALVKERVFVWYLVLALLGSAAAGVAYQGLAAS